MLREVTPEEASAIRDEVEAALATFIGKVLRSFLADVKRAALSGIVASPATALTAASPAPLPTGEVPTLGEHAARWRAGIDAADAHQAITDAFDEVWERYTDQGLHLHSTALESMEAYAHDVRDRLVRGTFFGVTVYDDSFEAVRAAMAQSVTEGWSRPELARRIAADLSWDGDSAYWQKRLSLMDGEIDRRLDAIGPPGNPVREAARLNDRAIQALRDERNIAIKHLDAEKSVWQTRANLIARTESTGIANYGAQAALEAEGVEWKVWMATGGLRTRPTHSRADHQKVRIGETFAVGRAQMRFPGDPNGPVEEVANCRCTMVGGGPPNASKVQTDIDRFKAINVDPKAVKGIDWLAEPEDAIAAMKAANTPYYKAIRARTQELSVIGNCQKATAAHELRRRGLDAVATLGDGGQLWGTSTTGFYDWFGIDAFDVRLMGMNIPRVNYTQISRYITTTYPKGARGSLVCQWKYGGGHIFNWEVDSATGLPVFTDAQIGAIYGPSSQVWNTMKKELLQVVRLDDKRFRIAGSRAVMSPKAAAEALAPTFGRLSAIRDEIESLSGQISRIVDKSIALIDDVGHEGERLALDMERRRLQAKRAALYDELDEINRNLKFDTTAIQGVVG